MPSGGLSEGRVERKATHAIEMKENGPKGVACP